jgi:hypothetical protein
MKTLIAALVGQHKNTRVLAAALLATGAVGGWALAATLTPNAIASDGLSRFDIARKNDTKKQSVQDSKPSLIGSYVVSGTDPDGKPYAGPSIVDIALAPSGALELQWDNGKQVGIAEVIGNVLAISCLIGGRTAILIMNINPDGSLSGKWLRRTDRGYKGTEIWRKA